MPFTTQGRMLQQKDKRLLEISLQCSVFYRLFLLPSTKKSQQTGNETAALPFFVWIFSLCLHDWQTWCFTFQTVTFPPQTVFKSHGGPARSNLSEVPISFWHVDVLRDLEEEVIPPALAPLFFQFYSVQILWEIVVFEAGRNLRGESALLNTGWRPQQSEGPKRVLGTCPDPEQARLWDTVTHGTTNKISFAMRTSTFLMHLVLWSRNMWFSLELWNAI